MRYIIGSLLIFLLWGTSSADIVSVSVKTTALRSYPSSSNTYDVLKVPQYYPLSILKKNKDFYNVSDFLGRTGWIHKDEVDETKSVVVKAGSINIRKGPNKSNEVIFIANKGVTFKVVGEQKSWLNVLHESGKKGWLFKEIVWGW